MKEDTPAGLESMVFQVVLDLQDPKASKESKALMVNRVNQDTQECLVIKVSLCIYIIIYTYYV